MAGSKPRASALCPCSSAATDAVADPVIFAWLDPALKVGGGTAAVNSWDSKVMGGGGWVSAGALKSKEEAWAASGVAVGSAGEGVLTKGEGLPSTKNDIGVSWAGAGAVAKGEVAASVNKAGDVLAGAALAKGETADSPDKLSGMIGVGAGVACANGEAAAAAGWLRKGLGGNELAGGWEGSRRGGKMVVPKVGAGASGTKEVGEAAGLSGVRRL